MPTSISRPVNAMHERRNTPCIVVVYPCRTSVCLHEMATQETLARRIAAIRGGEYGGSFDPAGVYDRPLYFVPNDTLVRAHVDPDMGIDGEHDLFGGMVPHA
ncbi:DUF3182 family protein, partial [Noviherbaspirillum denitrificans]|uniref:DUF3182 family protein n=1 Tax=Noviherbaspirillum denitrificans TaxID=1968433 RepID=UPI001981C525